MKKVSLILFLSFAFLFLFSGTALAQELQAQPPPPPQGLVPCGTGSPTKPDGTLDPAWRRCELSDIFKLILNVYNFIILYIATPLAGLLIVIGGVLIIVSGGPGGRNPVTGVISPNLYSKAKDMILWTVVAIFLIFGSWLIINIVLIAIGYTGGIGFTTT